MRPCLVLLVAVSLAAAQPVDWPAVERETVEHFVNLLRIDTSNPPGNEAKAAAYLRGVLEREGIPAVERELAPGRTNLVARIRGNGSKKPLLIMGHTDVVGVQKEKWTVDPFAGLRKDGYIYGRGALDDKDNVATGLMTMLLLKRHNIALDRDVIFLAEADEESAGSGVRLMADRYFSDIEAEFCIAEGGGGTSRDGVEHIVTVATTEKLPRGVRLISRGTAGHGSTPRLDNAVVKLAAAVQRVAEWQPPMRLNDTTRTYFEKLANISNPAEAARYKGIFDPDKRPAIEEYFRQFELGHNSILRTSVSPNMIKAGFRQNVIPSEAEAYLDIRALPDEDIRAFYAKLKEVIGDPDVELVPNEFNDRPPAPPSGLDTEMYRIIGAAAAKVYPKATVIPAMLTGATDMAFLRAKGIQSYGIGPLIEEKDRLRGLAHGDDEKIREKALQELLRFLWTMVLDAAKS
jgi:acetylornithine deacetylase/succinyl-diaminopimelate desuccinylase-like protein